MEIILRNPNIHLPYRPSRRELLAGIGGMLAGVAVGGGKSLAAPMVGDTGLLENWPEILSGAPGITGVEKWFPRSNGMDIFVVRETGVKSPIEGTVARQTPNGLIIVARNGFSVRLLHVVNQVRQGSFVRVGDLVARVNDPSLDQFRWPASLRDYAPPDNFQHLDLAIGSGPDEFPPIPGEGGDKRTFDYVYNHGGLLNIYVIQRTPGPQEGLRAW